MMFQNKFICLDSNILDVPKLKSNQTDVLNQICNYMHSLYNLNSLFLQIPESLL